MVKTFQFVWTYRRVLVRCLRFGPLASVTEPEWQLSLTGTHNKLSLLPYCLVYDIDTDFVERLLFYIKKGYQHLSCPCIYLQCLCFKSLGWSRWNAAGNTFIYFSLLTIMAVLSILLFLLLFLLATTHRIIVKCDWDNVPCRWKVLVNNIWHPKEETPHT